MKKNLAVAMAGMMSVASVVPVFANEVKSYNTADLGELRSELKELLSKKFAPNDPKAGQNVYTITFTAQNVYNGYITLDGIDEFIKLVTNNPNLNFTLTVTDEGHSGSNGVYTSVGELTYGTANSSNSETVKALYERLFVRKEYKNYEVLKEVVEDENDKFVEERVNYNTTNGVLTLVINDSTIELKDGDKMLNFNVGLDDDNKQYTTQDQARKITKFAVATNMDLPSVTSEMKLNASLEYKLEDLYDGLFLTEEGEKFLEFIAQGKDDQYSIEEIQGTGIKYTFTAANTKEKMTYLIKSTDDVNLLEFKEILTSKQANVKFIGDTRYSTAVEVANASYKNVNHIVLVNGTALVDGLAAAPYAKENNAPILLTEKDVLPTETLNYIKSQYKTNSQLGDQNNDELKITIVGGTGVVSEKVVAQLREIGANEIKVNRLAGADRHETSLAVANAMTVKNKAFVVGANGEADAMSVAAVAARDITPIIVSGFDGMSKAGIEFVSTKDVDIIGGKTVVSTDVENHIKRVAKTVDRVYGDDRYATNAKVIGTYYDNKSVDRVYVAKDGMAKKDQLVDSLTVAPLAAQGKDPIVLATDSISQDQQTAVQAKVTTKSKITQVGGGISSNVINKLAAIMGLVK